MTRAHYPTTWPGTAIIKSTHTAFNWRSDDHLAVSDFARDPGNCTTTFNQWRVMVRQAPLSTPDWPTFRDARAPKVQPKRGPKTVAPGFGKNGGTIKNLSAKADKITRFHSHGLPSHITRAPARPSQAGTSAHGLQRLEAEQTRHSGAYSRVKVEKT